MIKNKRLSYIAFALIVIASLIVYSLKDSLLDSNFSRIANKTIFNYLSLFLISCLYGLCLFISLKTQHFRRLKYLGLISMLIGAIIPYNYLEVNSFNSNLHFLFAIISCASTLLIAYLSINRFSYIFPKIGKILFACFIIVIGIGIYLYGKYMFVNSLNELILLIFVLISQMIIYNKELNKWKL